jgi:hypothetical protein
MADAKGLNLAFFRQRIVFMRHKLILPAQQRRWGSKALI